MVAGLPGFDAHRPAYFTRPTYSPDRVSTLMISSWPTNKGTLTVAPVSSLAGLPPPPEVSPRTPGSVSTISNTTKLGGTTDNAVPFHNKTMQISCSLIQIEASVIASEGISCCSYDFGSIKCHTLPSLYIYCISSSATSAPSTVSPDL